MWDELLNPNLMESDKMASPVSDRAQESMELLAVSQAQGISFAMEQGRLAHLEGRMGMREGLTHRVIGESGSGQARAHLPGGNGGVPTVGT